MNKKGGLFGLMAIVIGMLVLVAMVYSWKQAFTTGTETIVIKEKWVKYKGTDAKYLVSSTNGQVFEITDSWVNWRWDSSNTYADLTAGETCLIKTQGFRFPFFSDYKNIIGVNCQ